MAGERPIRVAVIGYGMSGSLFHAPFIAATPGMSVAAIVTSNPQRQDAARTAHPGATILSTADDIWRNSGDYDLVVVGTPNRSHVPLGMAAIEAGLPVVLDKPLAPSAEAGRRLIEAAEQRGVLLSVYQNRRWDGDFRTLRAILDQDLLGTVVDYESRFERYRPVPQLDRWRESADPEDAGGMLFDLGSHLIDQAIVLFGPPRAVYAEMACRRPGAVVDDDTFVALHHSNGVQAHLWMNRVVLLPGPLFHVSGLHGSYVKYGLDPQEEALKAGGRPDDPGWGRESEETWGKLSTEVDGKRTDHTVETLPGRYQAFYTQMAAALTEGAPVPVPPRQALQTLIVIEAARTSAQERRVVELSWGP